MNRRSEARAAIALAALVATAAVPVAAQERPAGASDLPVSVAQEVVAFLNDAGIVRFDGPGRLPAGTVLVGDVGVLGGPFTIDGTVRGRLVVVNGDVEFGQQGRVEGDVTVVGGEVLRSFPESVTGTVTVYDEPLAYAENEGRISYRRRRDTEGEGATFLPGRSRFMLRSAGTYNRVEGLPVLFGPVVEGGTANPWRVEVMALWRSESGLALDNNEMGYLIRAEQRLGARPTFVLGGSYYSLISPLATAGLSELESSLSTFFLHKDFRDYMEHQGWNASLGLDLDPLPVTFRVTWADETQRFTPVSSPWTIRKNDDPWRPQPLVAEGGLRSLTGEVRVDDRNDPVHPSDGWLVSGSLTRGVDGDLEVPETVRPGVPDPIPVPARPVDAGFTAGTIDVRRYNRVSPDAELDLRMVYGGSLDGRPLPSQYQQALGGEGTLPGYSLFSLDCGARSDLLEIQRVAFDDDADTRHLVFPSYGCDRALLFQVEFRGRLPFSLDFGPNADSPWTPGWDWYPVVDLEPTWTAFFDLGRGWSESDPTLDTGTRSDLGLGLSLGDLGFYWAWPLEGEDRAVNFFVRLRRRF